MWLTVPIQLLNSYEIECQALTPTSRESTLLRLYHNSDKTPKHFTFSFSVPKTYLSGH